MATITVLDSAGATQTVAKIANTGTAVMASSLPMTIATDDTVLTATNTKLDTLHTDITAATPAGTNLIGKVGVDQTTPGTTNAVSIAQIAATTVSAGDGASGSGTLRVVLANNGASIGALTETAPANDTASSGLNGRLQRVAQNLSTLHTDITATNAQLPATLAGNPQTTITRPANTTAYTALDVVGGALTFATGLTSGQCGIITGCDLIMKLTALPAGMTTFTLHLYDVTPPSAIADNGAWTTTTAGDQTAYLGSLAIPAMALIGGGIVFSQADNLNHQIKLNASANVFGYLVTTAGYTPAANSEVYLLRLHLIGS